MSRRSPSPGATESGCEHAPTDRVAEAAPPSPEGGDAQPAGHSGLHHFRPSTAGSEYGDAIRQRLRLQTTEPRAAMPPVAASLHRTD